MEDGKKANIVALVKQQEQIDKNADSIIENAFLLQQKYLKQHHE